MFGEMPKRMPSAILLDLDNTLYPYAPAHTGGMNAAMEKARKLMGITPQSFTEAYDKARKEIHTQLGDTASSHSRLLYFQRVIEMLGYGTQVLHALDLEQAYWRGYLANAKLYDGVEAFLDDLRLYKIPVALVTDLTTQIQFRKLIYFRIDRKFDAIVTSEEIGADKPCPDMYTMALRKLGYTSGDVWAIGDDARKDCWGAKKECGAFTFQMVASHGEAKGQDGVDCAFRSWNVMSDLLAKLSNNTQETSNNVLNIVERTTKAA